ncbi:MAG TPA: helix-turn-helix domain-containing protein [Rhodocyclaceae bacterium]|nr:helix-turn-helix domain-containing protein [Rhodocyclaceae bacterium]
MPSRPVATSHPSDLPLLRVVQAQDADEHAANLSQWDQLYDQLTPGNFEGSVTELWLPQSQIFVETANQTLRQSCAAWDDSIWFGIPAPGQGLMSWGGRELPPNAVCVREGGAEFELRTAPNFNLFGIVVEREAFGTYLESTHQRSLDDLLAVRDVMTLPLALKADVCSKLSAILTDADSCLPYATAADGVNLQGRIFASLVRLLSASDDAHAHASRRDYRQAYRHPALDRLRNDILEQPGTHFSVDDLCERFHLSRRALQNYFEEATGLAPLAYMRALRLNAARRALKQGESAGTVSEVAYTWGFNHLGKFAQQYHAMFGELPSQTRHNISHHRSGRARYLPQMSDYFSD